MNHSREKKNTIPEAPVPPASSGNLLSSVAPPSELPNFITASIAPPTDKNTSLQHGLQPKPVIPIQVVQSASDKLGGVTQNMDNENFSPAIPLSKGEPRESVRSPEDSESTTCSDLPSTPDSDKIGNVMPGSGLFTWVKGAVSSGGILKRVAEKAKSSVDSMITTLDPQMKEYLNSGGDISIVVASDKDVKISPIREGFQAVFGKATVVGYAAQSEVTAVQPVGYPAAYAAAKQRIAHVRSTHTDLTNNVPIVAVESYLQESISDKWYEIGLLVLSQPSLNIELQLVTQGVPVPQAAALAAREATPLDYEHAQTGYSVTIGSIMGDSLQVPHNEWHEVLTGVSRREVISLAARSLAGSYKRLLISATEA